jgi:hypothetical protein
VIKLNVTLGDTRAAVVVSLDPLLVAAYSDELDAIVVIELPRSLVGEESLTVGTRLVASNAYGSRRPACPVAADITPGAGDTGVWGDFGPIVLEFVSNDRALIESRRRAIAETEWRRLDELVLAHRRTRRPARDGRCHLGCMHPSRGSGHTHAV